EELSSFSEGLAAFYDGHGWGFINKEGEKKIKAKDDRTRVTNFINGYASFQVDDGTWGLIDKNGEKILRAKYDRPVVFFNGLAAILQDGEYGFINQEGDKVIVPEFNDMGAPFVEGNAIVKDGKYFIFIDKKGLQINKNEVANVEATIADLYRYGFAFDFDETVESQFVNITQILGRVVQSLSAEEINGFNETTTLGDIIKKYNVIDEEVSDNTYNRTLELIEDSVVNSLCSFNLTVIFKQNLMIWDEYSYDDVVSSDAHVNIIVYTLNLKGRAVPRYMEIVEVLKNMLLDTGLNLLESDEEDTYYFGESIEEFAAAISFEEGEITFGYLFHTQDEEEDAYEEGAVEEYEYDL
ncbi:MAG: WG repeat-containing protein, partial [Bacteroidetes bacterium]|nr:WG repeat-containing protein [Bacteroidota bacterium]